MKKNSSNSMFSKYSDTSSKKKYSKELPLMTTYEQRYRGNESMSKNFTEPKTLPTLEEKIEARKLKDEEQFQEAPSRVSVEIAGHNYLLGSNENISEAKMRRIAAMVNKILTETKEDNPGLTTSKITTLALLDACERIVTLSDENSNMKTELMYLQQKLSFEDTKKSKEPTPMEILADELSQLGNGDSK